MKLGRLQIFYYTKIILKFLPAPLFLVGFIHSIYSPPLICGTDLSMTIMWLVMCVAHLSPYILLWEINGCSKGCKHDPL